MVWITLYCNVDNYVKVVVFTMFWNVDKLIYSVDNFVIWLLILLELWITMWIKCG